MVEFEEIKDEHYEENDGFEDEEEGSAGDYSDVSSEDEGQDDSVQDETILDRIVALKDIIPAHQRDTLSRSISKAYSFGSMATFIGGKAIYILITSILMLGIPYALSLEEDKMISEQERQMQLQQGMSEVTTLLCGTVSDTKVLAPTAAQTLAGAAPESQSKQPVRPPGF